MENIIEQLKSDWKQYLMIDIEEPYIKIKAPQNYMEEFYKFIDKWVDNIEFDELIFAESKRGLPTYILFSEYSAKGEQRGKKYWTI